MQFRSKYLTAKNKPTSGSKPFFGLGWIFGEKKTDNKRYTSKNTKQTHRNPDIVPSILFVHRIALMIRQGMKQKKNNTINQTSSQLDEDKNNSSNVDKEKRQKKKPRKPNRTKIRMNCSMNSSSGAVG